mmetsp:Transcript_69943/g.191980  ORF Transcript_69943/g.191980 Transcript_69943/m.191980 type:complete len:113 (+) Transcript_69943:139-477(+)
MHGDDARALVRAWLTLCARCAQIFRKAADGRAQHALSGSCALTPACHRAPAAPGRARPPVVFGPGVFGVFSGDSFGGDGGSELGALTRSSRPPRSLISCLASSSASATLRPL